MRKINQGLCFLTGLTLFSVLLASAQEPLKPIRTDKPPIIDGELDDPVWQETTGHTGFKTYAPDFGKEMSEKTEAYVAYDNENLYFAFRCFDSQPQKIKAAVTSRDNINADDWVCINLDSFNDQQSLYAVYVNPLGIQGDSRFSADQEEFSFDLVWYSGGQIDDKGYTIEISIPFKSIRYSDKEPVEMAVVFERRISRRSEHGTYPPLDPAKGMAFLIQMKPMILHEIKHYALLEILPAWTYTQKYSLDKGELASEEQRGELSVTGKYGITSDLILDGTYDPDFSQIESDAGQVDVNLRYALYYPEKRPFFLEGNENLRLAATMSSEVDPMQSIIHTRTIVNPLAGVKLAGKIGAKNILAAIYALDDLRDTGSDVTGDYAHFPILRYKRALDEDSYLGGIYAGRELKNHFDRVGGLDGMVRLSESSLLEYHGLSTQAKMGDTSAVKWGHAIGLWYHAETRDIDYNVGFKDISDDFNAEMGYVTRTGILGFTGTVRPKLYPQSDVIQRIDAEVFTAQTRDKFSGLWETFNHISVQNFLWGSVNFKVKYSYSSEVFLGEKFKTGGIQVLLSGQFTRDFYFGVLYRRLKAIYYSPDPYQGSSNRVTSSMIYQPSDRLSCNCDFVYSDFYRESDSQKIYDYPMFRGKLTYQLNRYLFFRGVVEYNNYKKKMLTDFLASFTYIPGTVVHLGYGSLYEKIQWKDGAYIDSDRFLETKRGFFFKMSYLWRM